MVCDNKVVYYDNISNEQGGVLMIVTKLKEKSKIGCSINAHAGHSNFPTELGNEEKIGVREFFEMYTTDMLLKQSPFNSLKKDI